MTSLAESASPSPHTAEMAAWRRRVFFSTWLSYVGYYFARKPFSFAKSSIESDLHIDAATLGDIGATYSIAYAVGQFVASAVGPRVGPRIYLLAGMALSLCFCATMGVADSAGTFFLLMGLNGLAQASGWSSNVATMAAWTKRHERGRIMGVWSTNFQVGSLLSGLFLPWILKQAGWHYAFFGGAVVLLVVWGIFLALQRNRPEDVGLPPIEDADEPVATDGKSQWTPSVFINIALVGTFYFFMKIIRYGAWSWVPYFLERHYHLTKDYAGWVSNVFDIAGIPGVMFAGWASDRFFGSRRSPISFLLVLATAASCAMLYFAGNGSLPIFLVCLGLVGFTLIGPDSLMTGAGAMDIGSRAMALRVTAIISGLGALGQVTQDLVIGRLYDAKADDLSPIFALLLASASLAAFAVGIVALRGRMGRSTV
jgi:OPA family sugar phosphate sensor protein UhpC-like MFS transporter